MVERKTHPHILQDNLDESQSRLSKVVEDKPANTSHEKKMGRMEVDEEKERGRKWKRG